MRPARLGFALAVALLAMLILVPAGADATYPGRVGRIAFTDYISGEIFTVNPDGTRLRQLTHGGSGSLADFPSWSPTGKRLAFAFSPTPSAPARIWVVRRDGTNEHRLADDRKGFQDFDPNFGPSGRAIVFTRCRPDEGVCAIWRMRANGTHKRGLTPYRAGTNEALDINPSISPGGGRIVFTRFFAGGIKSRLLVMDANGRNAHPITPPRLEATSPDWAPNGRRLTFTSNAQRLGSSIFTVKSDGSGLRRVTPDRYPHNAAASVYSPRGNRLAFSGDRGYADQCCLDLFTIAPNGTHGKKVPGLLKHRGIINAAWGSAPLIR
jgi:TolB protein